MPLSRRSHKKSKTGCLSCKKRRIKCDEGKPTCGNCLQHRIQCEFGKPPAPNIFLQSEFSAPFPPRDKATTSPATLSRSPSNHQIPPEGIDTTDFKLLHHFTTSTYLTLSDQAELQYLWQIHAPELAFSHTYLLRMIFAISALHLCRVTSSTHYLQYAHQQYEAALRSSCAALSDISPLNCHALYACAAFGFIFELATFENSNSHLYSTDGLLAPWVVHLRGLRTILTSSWDNLESGVLKALFQPNIDQGIVEDMEVCLGEFSAYIQSIGVDNGHLSSYLVALQELLKWSKMVEIGFVGWMCHTSDEFVHLLTMKDPVALVIFAHSCVFLEYGEPKYWIGQWAKHLLREVYEYSDPSFRMWLEWPSKRIGHMSVSLTDQDARSSSF